MKAGDFSGLAKNYSAYRPAYSPTVAGAIARLGGRNPAALDAADVGAGTGIWTRMLAAQGFRSVQAVEPNDDMRTTGEADSAHLPIRWSKGTGEATGLDSASADVITMASSFHWVDLDRGIKEFTRVLRPGGWFVALWNPRHIESNPLLVEIEAKLSELKPDLNRVSSGRSGRTDGLLDVFHQRPEFAEVMYLEGRHTVQQTHEQYIGVWRSVNDIPVQLGAAKFEEFMSFVERRIQEVPVIETTYATRAWAARRA